MTYAVKEIFKTVQGEGYHAGRSAWFVRFAGCNLWSGREQDRASAVCKFCDTDFVGGERLTGDQIMARMMSMPDAAKFVVFTGGEPLLQLDAEFITNYRKLGWDVAVETNGTIKPPPGISWLCVSPKHGSEWIAREGDELKVVLPQPWLQADLEATQFRRYSVQPMDGDPDGLRHCLAWIERSPKWRLSLQTHKFIGIR